MVNGSFPVSIFEFPRFFVIPDKIFYKEVLNDTQEHNVKLIQRIIKFLNIPFESVKNYHYYWHSFNNGESNISIFCDNSDMKNPINCSDPTKFKKAITEIDDKKVKEILKNPERGVVINEQVSFCGIVIFSSSSNDNLC